MTTLNTGSKAKDQMYGTLNSTIWTTIEANTAIICACLPMLKSPLAALFPRLFPRSSSDDYPNGSNAARRRGMYSHVTFLPIGTMACVLTAYLMANTPFQSLPNPPKYLACIETLILEILIGTVSRERNTPPDAYDGWGRLESKKQSQRTKISTLASKVPTRKDSSLGSSSEDIFRPNSQDVPMGNINKTTHVDVRYASDGMGHPTTINPQVKDAPRTLSATHLVGEDFSFP